MEWKKSTFQGIRYREHKTRKHGIGPDRYYVIFYKLDGKMIGEALGWASKSWTEEDADGKKRRVNWTEKRASAVLSELKKNQRLGTGPRTLREKRAIQEREIARQKAESITIAEFWGQDYIHSLQGRIKPSSWKKEVIHFEKRIDPLMGNKAMKEITPEDVERMVDQMRADGLTPRTQEYAVGTLFRIWKHAAKRKLVKPGDNPAAGIKLERVNNTRTRVLTPQELNDILEYISDSDPHAYDISVFCAYLGCRFSEAAKLTWEHVDFVHETVFFADTKNRESRELPLEPVLLELLERKGQGQTGEHVFTKNDGSIYLEPPSAFKTAADNLGLNDKRIERDRVSFHTLRHTAATMAAKGGTAVKDMQLLFGWKTPAMVFRYCKGDKDAQRHAMKGLAQSLSGKSAIIIPLARVE
jgi:integrase